MSRYPSIAFLTLTALSGCARPTPDQQFINAAADALGGRNRIQAVKTLTIEGEGTNYNLGQDMKPDAATQQFAISSYTRQIDVANRRQRVEQTRTPKFAFFQGPQPQKQIQGLDDSVAFNVNYVPSARVLVEADAFSPGSAVSPYAASLLENIQKRKLRVDRIVPLHGAIAKMAELEKVAQ
jgi:hypothetical protein